ncbi:MULTISPECIES: DUF4286 family protein [Kitasatospora]|uniref:DUF4286 family protein n=1 Tax=Kitasatospora cathayae TaxID=3004092 RepID=A0ABY7QBD6_9ACTN|nr:DUF4286 family protein [Kitasatospora sp. HUAS 3-15]WBP90010.1 hypothetical protein O1G21_31970 [Kitasatospora sp. HUAS 3-15]
MSTYVITVLANVHEGRENDFHAWYENKHIPEILEVPGVVSVRRMTLNENQIAADESHSQEHYSFLTLIEIETEDFPTTLAGISELDGTEAADFLIPGQVLASLYRDPKLYTRR